MKKILLFLGFILMVFICYAQPEIEWSYNYGGSSVEYINGIQATSDDNYIVFGNSFSSDGDLEENNGESDIWLMKIDTLGTILWSESYGGSDKEHPSGIIETNEGGFIVLGQSSSMDGDITNYYGDEDIWIFKVDEMGEIIWSKNYGGSGFDSATSIIKDEDDGFIVAGYTFSNDGDISEAKGGADIWLFNINETGDLIWEKVYGGTDNEFDPDILLTNGGGLILLGISGSLDGDIGGNIGGTDLWLVKLSSIGEIEWEKNYGGPSIELNASIVLTENGYVLFGSSTIDDADNGLGYEYLAIRIDEEGNQLWEESYGGLANDFLSDAIAIPDESYIMAGRVGAIGADVSNIYVSSDIWIVKINTEGDIVWEKNYGGSEAESPGSILETPDGGLLVGGGTRSSDIDLNQNYGLRDAWIFKLAPFTTSTTNALIRDNTVFDIYPNPSDGTITIELEDQVGSGMIELINPLGVVVTSQKVLGSRVTIRGLPKGSYWVKYMDEKQVGVRKLVVE